MVWPAKWHACSSISTLTQPVASVDWLAVATWSWLLWLWHPHSSLPWPTPELTACFHCICLTVLIQSMQTWMKGGIFLKKKSWPLFVSLSIPLSFPSAAAQRGPVFSRCAFCSDLITYLFGLSYSKLHWLCVLLRAKTFLPPVLLWAFHPASWPLIAVTAQACRRAKKKKKNFSQLLCFWQFGWPTPLSLHRSQVT